jgi:hypothetical protein
MEERVRVCRACNAIVGWFALFCETCGAKQDPHTGGHAAPSTAGGTPAAAAAPPPAAVQGPPARPLEVGIRTQLSGSSEDARAVARELFQTQLRLIHKHREGVEGLLRNVDAIKKSLAAAERAGGRDAVRRGLDAVSEQVWEAEQKWGELQVGYNRESEMIEEESRENMEAADFDAYLSPDENSKVEAEFATLRGQFDRVDSSLRDVGRDLARARQEADSRYLVGAGSGGSRPWGLLAVTVLLVGVSAWFVLSKADRDHLETTAGIAGPLVFALGIWVILGFSRRRA